jgi:hypothetical protein
MNNTGSPSNNADMSEKPKPERSRFWSLFLPVAGLLVIGAAILMLQLFPILYAILLPPLPPLPSDTVELNHRSISYGVDEWTYESSRSACEVIQYYQEKDGVCPQVVQCSGDESSAFSGRNVAQCEGIFDFSIFTMRWISTISSDGSGGKGSVFQVSREIFWGGEIPPSMEDLIEQIEQTPGAGGN